MAFGGNPLMMALPLAGKQHQQLRALTVKDSFVAIVAGPPGSGKKTAIRLVASQAGLCAHDLDVEHAWAPAQLQSLIGKLGNCQVVSGGQCADGAGREAPTGAGVRGGNTIWVVHNAEILEKCAAVWKRVVAQGLRVVLVMHDVPRPYREHFVPIYFNRVPEARVKEFVSRAYPQSRAHEVAPERWSRGTRMGDRSKARVMCSRGVRNACD